MKKITPLKAVALGFVLAFFVELLLAANLTTFVGKYYGDGAGLTNVPAAAIVASATITNAILQWQMDATFEDKLYRLGTHGIELDYERIDLGSATALLRTVDGTLHFPNAPFIDGSQFLGNIVGVDPSTGQLVPISAAAPVQNFYTTNLYSITNYSDVFNSYFSNQIFFQTNVFINNNLTVQSNVTVNQNINVTGKASLTTVIITNTTLFSTNAFPLAPGTTWDWSRYHQFLSTNADCNITAITGLSNNLLNQAELQLSNAGASQIIFHLQFAMNKIGPNTTNDIYLASHKQAFVNGEARGTGTATNIVTLTEQ